MPRGQERPTAGRVSATEAPGAPPARGPPDGDRSGARDPAMAPGAGASHCWRGPPRTPAPGPERERPRSRAQT